MADILVVCRRVYNACAHNKKGDGIIDTRKIAKECEYPSIYPFMHMYVCLFVCMYACMYVCPHVYTYKRVFGVGLDFLIRVLLGVSSLHILYNAPLLQMLGKRKAPLLLVVDEMDQLLRGRDCDVLYNVGPPPKKKKSALTIL